MADKDKKDGISVFTFDPTDFETVKKMAGYLPDPPLFDTRQAAEYLGMSYSTLSRLRRAGKGPKYSKLTDNGTIKYTKEDLDQYIKERGES